MAYKSRPSGMILPLAVLSLAALGSSPAQATRDLAPHTHGVHRTLKVGAELHEAANLSNSVTVVVNFNMHNVVQLEVVQLLHTAYSAAFHRVVFTGQDRPTGLDRAILWSSCEFEWTYFSLCLAYTMAEWPESRQGGYIFVADDSIMDPCSMAPLNKTRFWTTELSFFPNVRDDREHSGYFWWGRKAALVEHHDGITANGSFALDMALTELPSFYKKRAHEVHGEHYVDEDGRVRLVVNPSTQDFLYVPAIHAADWIHLAHHFAHYGVMAEVAMPQIIYLLGGEDVEHPPTYNIVGHDWQTAPQSTHDGHYKVTDQDAEDLLRHNAGIYLPQTWMTEHSAPGLNTTSMVFYHAYKMSHAHRRELFLRWWLALPCLA